MRFSIVIPTRQRHETLGSAIKTILIQDFEDYEIVVSDNYSTSDTREVVESMSCSKIKYYRTDAALAMIDNWEFALSKSNGEYVIFLGDDDGLVNGALRILNGIIKKTDYKLIQWERIYYSWPNMDPVIFANKLHLRYNTENRIIEGHNLIRQVASGALHYTCLPMLYNSVVHSSLIKNHIRNTGRFFHSTIPDLYSGYVLANYSGRFLSLGVPMSINAGSAKSNGASFMFKKQSEQINKDFKELNSLGSIPFDNSIPYVRSLFIAIVEPYFKFLKTINSGEYEFNKMKSFELIIKNLVAYDNDELFEFSSLILRKAAEMKLDMVKIKADLNAVKISDSNHLVEPVCGFSKDELILDASEFGLTTVYDVSLFVPRFYNYKMFDFNKNDLVIVKKDLGVKMGIPSRIKKALKVLLKGSF